MPSHSEIQESGLLLSLPEQTKSLRPLLVPGLDSQIPASLHSREPRRPSSAPSSPAAPAPSPAQASACLVALRSGRCLFSLRDRWLGKREEREAALSPSPAARKWRGGQQVQQLPEGGGSDQFAPPAAAASGHPGPTGPTLGKASIATPHSASSAPRPVPAPWRARRLRHLCISVSLTPRHRES